ncbi:MAG TPA: DNA polymerase I [Firmicutes bacterium]|nr:DNA polymerase I [Bacillota bacterium]
MLWSSLKSVLQNPDIKIVTHDYKPLYKLLASRGIEAACTVFDTMLAAYLLEPARASYDLLTLCRETEGCHSLLPEDARDEQLLASCCAGSLPLMAKLLSLLRKQGLERLYFTVELPLVAVLARMEMRGVKVEKKVLNRLAGELQEELTSLEREIMALAGENFNVNSPKQLSKILFEKIGLPVVRRIKTGYSTDARALQELAAHHPIAAKLVQYRTVSKLINTYIDGLRPLIKAETGRIHTTFNQTVTATGRLSSSDPNLQNIPTRFAEGRRLREAFTVSDKDNIILSADYSQIELRIMAHLSEDEGLLDSFQRDQDVHTRTASDVFNVSLEEVTPQQRNAAKAVNFGIIYGISDYGLSLDLKISRAEAKKFIDEYFRRYSGVADYIKRCVETARREGYVTTLMSRRRYIPDINHPNHSRRGFAERVARNTPIQGSAADIIKAAMVAIDRELTRQGFAAAMLLQVHDELIFELPSHELTAAARCVQRLMEEAFLLKVPLKVDLKAGPDWYHLCPLEGDI